jgi:predicted nucleic acid-binding protein
MSGPIVSDSSPIISFSRAKKVYLIQGIYPEIIIPPAVFDEIVIKGKGKPGSEEIKNATWVKTQKPKNENEIEKLKERFGPGEAEALVLAEELKAVLLVDEAIIIQEARRRRLKITSTHLILEKAKDKGLIKSVKKELDELIASGFRTSPELIKDTLQKVGESVNP